MRLLVELDSKNYLSVENSIGHMIQGFIYDNLKNSFFSHLHNINGTKYFSFSLPFIHKEKIYIIISSPVSEIIDILYKKININERIILGKFTFIVNNIKKFNLTIKSNITINTVTPIIIRIKKPDYEKYKSVYWKSGDNPVLFVTQLQTNLVKKYENFYDIKFEYNYNLFNSFKFIRQVSSVTEIKKKNIIFIGSLWEFKIGYIDRAMGDFLKFSLDTGFGEMNSLGYGFCNIEKN